MNVGKAALSDALTRKGNEMGTLRVVEAEGQGAAVTKLRDVPCHCTFEASIGNTAKRLWRRCAKTVVALDESDQVWDVDLSPNAYVADYRDMDATVTAVPAKGA